MNSTNLRQLIERLASGDREATWMQIEGLVRLYVSRAFRARHAGHMEDEDVVQEVLIALQDPSTLQKVEQARSPEAYVNVIIRNKTRDIYRRRKMEHRLSVPTVEEIAPEEEPLAKEHLLELLEKEIKILKKSDRELLRLRFWKGYTIAKIASKSGGSYSKTAVRLFRLLQKLRDRVSRPGKGST